MKPDSTAEANLGLPNMLCVGSGTPCTRNREECVSRRILHTIYLAILFLLRIGIPNFCMHATLRHPNMSGIQCCLCHLGYGACTNVSISSLLGSLRSKIAWKECRLVPDGACAWQDCLGVTECVYVCTWGERCGKSEMTCRSEVLSCTCWTIPRSSLLTLATFILSNSPSPQKNLCI